MEGADVVGVGAEVGVEAFAEEVAKDVKGATAVGTGEGEEVELELGAHVVPALEGVEAVGEVEVALGMGDNGGHTGHEEGEEGLLHVAALEEVRHLNQHLAGLELKELGGVALLKAGDHHVLGTQTEGEGVAQVGREGGEEGIVAGTEEGLGVLRVDVGVGVGGEDHGSYAYGLHLTKAGDGLLEGLDAIVDSGEEVTVAVGREREITKGGAGEHF